MENLVIAADFWQGKKVLLTGHTGFKGSWLSLWLQQMGAELIGLSLAPITQPNLFDIANVAEGMDSYIADISDLERVQQIFQLHQPDIVIHMAAQALVRYSYQQPIETYQTNVMGTLNILEAMRTCNSVKAAIMVTTDKCYDNVETHQPYKETDALGGHDPYSSSKACAELLIASYRHSFFNDHNETAIASVRAGNVIGGGDWSQDRLIPDIIKAQQQQQSLAIRSAEAIRPWQHVLDPLHGYLLLAERLYNDGHNYAQAWNFGPSEQGLQPVKWIVDYFANNLAGFSWQLDEQAQPHEATILKLDCTKAQDLLGWRPYWSLEQALDKIIDWHQAFDQGKDMRALCEQQLTEFAKQIS